MKVSIKEIRLGSFKGCKERVIKLGENNEISGANGVGKTTIATAWLWLMSDRDYELHSNPNIRPLNEEECTPRVEVVLNIDGKEVIISKQQKRTVSKPNEDGVSKVSLSNSYEINAVPKSERDFKAYLNELGVDFELFLPLSHPSVFTSQKASEMRKVLFSMASEKTDYEIAKVTVGAGDVVKLLENYSMEEVEAMNKSTLRKIKEDYGKDGEILRAKIEGLELSKVDIDVAELELQKNALLEQINENKAKLDDLEKQRKELEISAGGVMELKFKLSDMERKVNEDNISKRTKLTNEIELLKGKINSIENTVRNPDVLLDVIETSIKTETKRLDTLKGNYEGVQKLNFNDKNLVCDYCGQEYPAEKKETLKVEFENKKTKSLNDIAMQGHECKKIIEQRKIELEETKAKIAAKKEEIEKLNTEIANCENELSKLPELIDVSGTDEYKNISQMIKDKEETMAKSNSLEYDKTALVVKNDMLGAQLRVVERELAKSETNVQVDEKIAELREKQAEYEQSRADAEKILYQLDLVSRKKNELLTEEINSHFEIVDFQMFDFQKNGNYKEVCVPLIDGKRFGESTNTGREILAKLDIIKGLQKFYGLSYPVFLDGAESLDSKSRQRIDMNCQMVYLAVSEDQEIKIN